MKSKFTAILGVAVLSSAGQIAFAQMGTTPALQNNWSYPTSPSPEQVLQNGMQPIQNAVNIYGQRQFDTTMQLEQQAFAAQQQQQQLDADAAAQALAMQQQAQVAGGYPANTIPNAFSQFYQDRVGASITNALPYSGNTKILTSLNTTNDLKNLLRDNYAIIGVSSFQGPPQSQDAVMAQAEKVGADVVLLTVTYPGNQLVTTDRYLYLAGFFRKMKTPVLGTIPVPLPSEIRQQLERNTGVFVEVVKNDTPAFNANILEGDVILKMNGEDVESVSDFNHKCLLCAGQMINLQIWRNGQFKTISVQLNNLPGVPPVPSPSDSLPQSSAWDDYVKIHPEWALKPVPSSSNSDTPVIAATLQQTEFDREKKLAENGNPEAQDKLGIYYEFGKGVAKDEVEAAKWFRKAADQGSAVAERFEGIYYLGMNTANGTPDYVEAAKWFNKAADQNDAFAELCLGDLYADGNGVPQDYSEALKWYRNAANQGNALAQYNLGCYYEFGKGVTKDAVEAAKWFRKAADQGSAAAQYSLGYCYCKGEGVEANAVEGYKWCSLASTQGNEGAKKILTILDQKMTPEQIAEAQRLSMAFQPHTESATTNSN
ncbi:MAG: PDZ domain-containing protein [Verrucomicrobiia bacterium]